MTDKGKTCKACPNKAHMGEYACEDRTKCWEPCGQMGKSEAHVRVVPRAEVTGDDTFEIERVE